MCDPVRTLVGASNASEQVRAKLARTVSISLADQASWEQQLIAECLVDLLRRVLPSVHVALDPEVPAHARLPPGPVLFAERVARTDSYGCAAGAETEIAMQVILGADQQGPSRGDVPEVHVNGRGWISYVGPRPGSIEVDDAPNPIGPLAAACRAAARVTAALLGEEHLPTTSEASYWDALTHAPVSTDPPARNGAGEASHLDAVLAGCGSIGGAAAYAWARVPGLSGRLTLLDPDRLEDRNQVKAILARPPEVAAKTPKAQVAAGEVAGQSGLSVEARTERIADFVAGRSREDPLPLMVCAVDSVNSRRELQDSLPKDVINAACGASDIALSGHVTGAGPCVYCLHIERVLDREQAQIRILERETSMPAQQVAALISTRAPLETLHLRRIESHRGLQSGALTHFRGRTLEELFREEMLYGEQRLSTEGGGEVVVTAPHVTALAGVLAAAETLKAGCAGLAKFRLGPGGPAIRYSEDLARPGALLTNPARFPGLECLCNDPRRQRLLRERYGG